MYRQRLAGLVLALLLPLAVMPAESGLPADPWPKAAAAYLVVVNGAVLWARAPDRALPPASLTKIMTALLVLEHWAPEEIVTISPLAAAATGSRLGLRASEQLSMASAFEALLVNSANDACLALAEHVAGSVAGFVRQHEPQGARTAARRDQLSQSLRTRCAGASLIGHATCTA